MKNSMDAQFKDDRRLQKFKNHLPFRNVFVVCRRGRLI
jgi:hypothetical protein